MHRPPNEIQRPTAYLRYILLRRAHRRRRLTAPGRRQYPDPTAHDTSEQTERDAAAGWKTSARTNFQFPELVYF